MPVRTWRDRIKKTPGCPVRLKHAWGAASCIEHRPPSNSPLNPVNHRIEGAFDRFTVVFFPVSRIATASGQKLAPATSALGGGTRWHVRSSRSRGRPPAIDRDPNDPAPKVWKPSPAGAVQDHEPSPA